MLTNEDLKKIQLLLKPIKKEVKAINKKLDIAIRYFDRVTTDHEERIRRVEGQLKLPKLAD